jgi:integrase
MGDPERQHKPTPAKRSRCPLRLHRTGQWYKKIHGKFYYFGKDKEAAVRAYEEQATYLHTGKGTVPASMNTLTLCTLCNLYLEQQEARLHSGEISPQHFHDQTNRLRAFAKYIGATHKAAEIVALDIQNFRTKRINEGLRPNTINNDLAAIKALFHWAEDNEVLEKGPRLRAIKKVKVNNSRRNGGRAIAETKQTFTPQETRSLIDHATAQMRAMIWMGLNCAFGCTDVAELRWEDIDFENGEVSLPRSKTGVTRNHALWPETLAALQAVSRQGPLVFYTSKGNPFVRTHPTSGRHIDTVSNEFAKLIKAAGIKVQKGTGFYTLRRTATTVAAKTGDPYAVQGLLGHKDTRMASTYIQDTAEQAGKAVAHVNVWLNQRLPAKDCS